MSWPEYDAALAASRPEPPFRSGMQRDEWQDRNCSTCVHDAEQRGELTGPGCPLLNVVLLDERTPAPWIAPDDARELHRCIDYRHEDDGDGPEPRPVPDPPGQLVLGPREPLEGVRMLASDPLDAVLADHGLTDGPTR